MPADRRPNIMLFITDDQPAHALGIAGNAAIHTPNIDALAQSGVYFRNAFVTTSICAVSRASILTGQTMARHGIDDFDKPLSADAFARTYPALLRAAGYFTGYIGKYAVGAPKVDADLALPSHRFDYWYGFPQQIDYLVEDSGEERYLTTVMTEKSLHFLRDRPRERPFLLTVAFKEPKAAGLRFDPEVPDIYAGVHIPEPRTLSTAAFDSLPSFIKESANAGRAEEWLGSPKSYQSRMRTEYRLISRADMAVGQIMAELQELGLARNTVVIFTSDNGSMHGAHGLQQKWLMYEESIRVPLIFNDPRSPSQEQMRQVEEMVLNIDIAPTILALAGLPPEPSMEGRDFQSLIRQDDSPWREDWFYEHRFTLPPPRPAIPRSEGVRTTRWKYIRYTDMTPNFEQLFDLAEDPHETNNLAGTPEYTEVLERLRRRCDELRGADKR